MEVSPNSEYTWLGQALHPKERLHHPKVVPIQKFPKCDVPVRLAFAGVTRSVDAAEIVIREVQGTRCGLQHSPAPGGEDAERQLQPGDGFLQLGMAVSVLTTRSGGML